MNDVQMSDSFFKFYEQKNTRFVKSSRDTSLTQLERKNSTNEAPLYSSSNWLDEDYKVHSRQVYNCLDLMGDVAGVLEIIILFFSFFVNRFIDQSYFLKLTRRIFLAHTKD